MCEHVCERDKEAMKTSSKFQKKQPIQDGEKYDLS